MLPVIAMGWLFGMWAGLLASLAVFLQTTLLIMLAGGTGWIVMSHGAGLLGSALIVLIGVVVGGLHDLGEKVRQELAERGRAEEALRLAEEKYRNIFENAVDGIFQSTPEGRFLTVNPAFARMLGYGSPEEMLATITDISRQIYVDSPRRADFMQVMAEQGSVTGFEFQMRRKDGSTLWVSENARAVHDAEGRVLYYEGTAEDITRRKQAEESLRASEERYYLLFNQMLDGFALHEIICDEAGKPCDYRFLEINPAFEAMTGLRGNDIIGKRVLEVLPETEAYWIDTYGEVALTGKSVRFENYSQALQKYFEVVAFSPRLGEFATIFVDVTERKHAEEQIARQSAVLNAVNQVFQKALTCETEEALARKCLAVAEQLTGSKFGFLGEVNPAGLFDTIAISNPGWDACKMPESDATRLIKNMPIRGVDRSTLREEKSRIVNDPATHPDRVGVPAGHPPITSFLGVPLKQAGKTIGMIGLANREGGYTDTQREDVETLAVAMVETLMRKRAEIDVRRHLAQIEALREIDKATTSTLDLSEVLDIILKELEQVIPYHSAAIFLLSDDTARVTAGRGFPDMTRVLQVSFPVEEDALIRELLQEKRPLILADAQTDKRFLARGGTEYIRSWIGVPLISKGKAVGILTIDHREPGIYGEESAEMAEAFANQVAIAVENARLYEASRRQAARAEALVRVAARLNAQLDLQAVLDAVCEETAQALSVSAVCVFLCDEQRQILYMAALTGLPVKYQTDYIPTPLARYEEYARKLGPTIVVTDVQAEPGLPNHALYAEMDIRTCASASLLHEQQLIGTLTALTIGRERGFTADELALLQGLADQAALAITNARLYAAQQETNAQLRAALQAKDEMIQNVSHELRTPLTIIEGYTQLLEPGDLGPLTAEQEQAVRVMHQQEDKLLFMVDRLLLLRTLDRKALRKIELEPAMILRRVVDAWQEQAAAVGLQLCLELSPELPSLLADPDLLGQVFANLLDNAVKFSPGGGVVRIKASPKASPRWRGTTEVLIAFSDQGIGIPPDKAGQLFERFYQADGSTTRRFGGMGIGLALCQKIVEAHDGRIWAESAGEGQGSTFYVALPVA
jgi:PAS domain S-box-containing protein